MQATAKAHTNIALIKYWGKRNESLILPTNNSLSLTLDGFYTTTMVHFRKELTADQFFLNEESIQREHLERVTYYLDMVRDVAGESNLFAYVKCGYKETIAAGEC